MSALGGKHRKGGVVAWIYPRDNKPQPVKAQPPRNAATLANTKMWVAREPIA
jgi:hypothetical protein